MKYIALVVAVIVSLVLLFHVIGIDRSPEYFMWPLLYYGSAVIQAYAALIAIPFAIWVLYMQSRFGYLLVRLFINKVIAPLTILGAVTVVSAITLSLANTGYAYYAFLVEVFFSIIFLPYLINYIRGLITVSPEDLVKTLKKVSRKKEEFIATSLHILRLVLVEAYPEDKVINNIISMITGELERPGELTFYPEVWYRYRDLIKTIVREGTFLPEITVMKNMMKKFMVWAVESKKESVARAFIRYHRMITLRYMEERLPSEAVEELYLQPVIDTLKMMRARKSLLGYSVDQLIGLLQRIKRAGDIGDITSLEMCHIVDLIDKHMFGLAILKEYDKLKRLINEIRGEFLCIY